MQYFILRHAKLVAVIAACLLLAIAVSAAPLNTFVTPTDITADSFWRLDYWDFNPTFSPAAVIAEAPVALPGYGRSALNVIPGPGQGGSGCDRLGGKPHLGTQDLDGVTLSSINALSYSYLVEVLGNGANPDNNAPYINIFVDRDGDGSWRFPGVDTILVYEPLYTRGNNFVDVNTWYTDVVIGTGANGRWHTAAAGITGIGAGSPVGPNDTWDEIMGLDADDVTPGVQPVGDLTIINPDPGCDTGATLTSDEGTGSGLSFVVGQKSGDTWQTFEGFIDAVVFDVEGVLAETAFDFALYRTPATIAIVEGDNQHATINTPFDTALKVQVKDEAGNPVEGVPVQFAVLTRQASATFTPSDGQDITDANGFASVNVTADGTVGSYQVVVTTDALYATFDLTNDPDAAVAPTNLAAVAAGHTTVNLSWTSTSTSADTLALYRSTDGVNFTAIAAPLFSDTAYSDTGLVCGTGYSYYLKVTNAAGTDDSNTVAVTTTACTELLVNGSFELAGATAKVPSGWKPLNLAGDKRICNVLHAADGTCALQFKGGAGENAMFRQVVGDISALTAGDTLYLSGAFKSTFGSPKVTVMAKVKFAGLPVQKVKLSFVTTQAAYIHADAAMELTAVPTKIIVLVRNNSAGGKQYVDDVSLTFNNATRAAAGENGILPPPASPAEFRGSN